MPLGTRQLDIVEYGRRTSTSRYKSHQLVGIFRTNLCGLVSRKCIRCQSRKNTRDFKVLKLLEVLSTVNWRLKVEVSCTCFVQTRTRKRKNTEQHEYCEENKVRRKEEHAQWLNNLSNCTEIKVLGEGAFGKVGKFKIKDNYPSGIPIFC